MDLSSQVIVVTGYPENCVSDIHAHMDQVGKVLEVVARKDTYFVLFETPTIAAQAIKDLHLQQVKGNQHYC